MRYGLHFDQSRQKGVVFHMMNALAELGLVGLTAVGNSRHKADELVSQHDRRAWITKFLFLRIGFLS